MPDKEEPYIPVSNVICAPSYQDLTLQSSSQLSNAKKELPLLDHIGESSASSCHTAFPVDLKEVFELTNPNAEIHHSMLQSSDSLNGVAMQYAQSSPLLSPKSETGHLSESEVPWRHVLREQSSHSEDLDDETRIIHSIKDHPSSRQNSWDDVIERSPELCDEDESLHPPKSTHVTVISNGEAWAHVIKHTLSPNKIHLLSASKDQIIVNSGHRAWDHILEDIPNSSNIAQLVHSHPEHVLEDPKQCYLVTDHDIANIPPIDLSGSSTKCPDRRDASCQVDDISSHATHSDNIQDTSKVQKCSDLSSDHEISLVKDNQTDLLNLTINAAESSQVLVHDGIKPELYTEERHLLVQAGTKAQAPVKAASTFPCNHCSKVFGDSRSLQRHMLIHVGLRPYRCPVCSKSFMLNGDLTRHIRIHSGEKPYSCDICGRKFTLKGNLMQHFRTHTPEKQYTCTICHKNYAQKDSLHRHIRAHFGEKPFECTTCLKRFTLKGDLSRHILIHSGVKPHSCKHCGRQFALKGNLTQHVRTHVRTESKSNENEAEPSSDKTEAEPPLICDLSHSHPPKTFVSIPDSSSSKSLECMDQAVCLSTVHPYVQTSPPPEVEHPSSTVGLSFCSACSKTFQSPEGLHEHVHLVHEQSTRLASNHYLCNICRKEFTLKGDLTRHLNSHNGVKPYQCEYCNKSFTLKSNLRQHMTTHRADKSFDCPMCSKSFGNRRNLNLHMRRHEQARANFACTKCGRSFLAKSDHFFHDCSKADPESSDNPPPAVANSSSPPNSPEEMPTDMQQEAVAMLNVKQEEAGQLPVGDEELEDSVASDLSSVSGAQTFLGPFYRHLYFSTSHSSMIPTLKGLLHASTVESVEFNRTCKN